MEIIPKNITVQPNSIAIVGWDEGAAGQIHSWLEKSGQYHIACFINHGDEALNINEEKEREKRDSRYFDYPKNNSFKGIPMITSLRWEDILHDLGISKVLITGIPNDFRSAMMKKVSKRGLEFISAIHPSALIMEDAVVGENVIIHARAIIGYRAEICEGAIICMNAQVDHNDVVRRCALIGPGVIMAGNVTVGEFAYIWTGAVIINRIRIGKNAVVGAGAVVIRDVPECTTVAGVPARKIK